MAARRAYGKGSGQYDECQLFLAIPKIGFISKYK
jgi:hypothetical protein